MKVVYDSHGAQVLTYLKLLRCRLGVVNDLQQNPKTTQTPKVAHQNCEEKVNSE